MQKITVNENDLRTSIRKQLHEDAATARGVRSIIDKLYRCANHFGGIYHDMGWGNVTKVMEALASVEGVTAMNSGAGEYHDYLTSANDQRPASRTYALTFETVYGINIDGELKCHSAGTAEDPFKFYDITCQFWRHNDNY